MTEDEIGSGYVALMDELKARVDTIIEFASDISPPSDDRRLRHNYFLFEALYLQLRKVCEIIALAMLLVHRMDGSGNTRRLRKEWRADKLIDEIVRINPSGFPKRIADFQATPGSTEQINEHPPVFIGEEIKGLYYQCGDRLHMGSLKSVLSGRVRELDQGVIQSWAAKFQLGLANHMIVIPSRRRSFLVTMEDPKTKQVIGQFATLAE